MQFSQPKKTADGRYYVKVKNGDDKMSLQLNNVTLLHPFAEGDDVTIALDTTATAKLDQVDTDVLKAARENSTLWFSREVAEKTLKTAYVRSFTDTTMNVSKAVSAGKVLTVAFDSKRNPVDPNTLVESTVCDVMVELVGIWFMQKTFGPTWRIVQIRTKAPPRSGYSDRYMFTDDQSPSSDDDM